MKLLSLLLVSLALTINLHAQCAPEVEKIVQELQEKVESSNAYAIDFTLEQAYVGESAQTQSGKLLVHDNKFRLTLPDQKILSNGQALWIVLDDAKEVQIMSLDESTGLGALSPINILEQYCGDQFMAESMGTKDESGESMEIIEVAPLDKSEDIFKIRIEYHTEKKEIRKVKTFSKDGSRIILVASNYNFTPDFADVDFEYDSAQHPDYHIEDLR